MQGVVGCGARRGAASRWKEADGLGLRAMTDSPKPGKRIATYEDVLRAPSDKIAEVLAGELVLTPRPRFRHQAASGQLREDLGPFVRAPGDPSGPGGWWILIEPEL